MEGVWQSEGGIAPGEVIYRRALHQVEQLDTLEADYYQPQARLWGW